MSVYYLQVQSTRAATYTPNSRVDFDPPLSIDSNAFDFDTTKNEITFKISGTYLVIWTVQVSGTFGALPEFELVTVETNGMTARIAGGAAFGMGDIAHSAIITASAGETMYLADKTQASLSGISMTANLTVYGMMDSQSMVPAYGSLSTTNGTSPLPALAGAAIKVPLTIFGASNRIAYPTDPGGIDSSIIVLDKGVYEVNWHLTCFTASDQVQLAVKVGKDHNYMNQLTVVKTLTSNQEVTFMGSAFTTVYPNTVFDLVITAQDANFLVTVPGGGVNAFLSVKKVGEWED